MNDQNLEARVKTLETWMNDRTKQQIVYPIDTQSQRILNEYFVSQVDSFTFTNSSGQTFDTVLFRQNNKIYAVSALSSLVRFTVDASSDVVYLGLDVVTGAQGSYANNTKVHLESTGTLPAPLTNSGFYYVVSSAVGGTQFKLSLTLGGAAIDITTAGTGTQYMYSFI